MQYQNRNNFKGEKKSPLILKHEIMCLYPKFIKNKAYSEQRFLAIGTTMDERKKYVPVGCGECLECRKQKAQQWRVRLQEELKYNKYAYFVTLTFSNESLEALAEELKHTFNYEGKSHTLINVNATATLAVRRFLERWRKKYKHSLKHWLITELGHENTERIHLHGILFNDEPISNELLQSFWKYGNTDTGQYCNERSINYIVKYVTKIDTDHKDYKAVILCSAGIGAEFVNTIHAKNTYRYIKGQSAEFYTLKDGHKVALPIYYRNKLYNEKERANLWTDRLDKGEIYVNGIRIKNINTDEAQKYYYRLLEEQQKQNKELGYGSPEKEWQKQPYNITWKMLQQAQKRNN